MKFCSNCGKPVDDNDAFCQNCGAPCGQQENTQFTAPVDQPQEYVQETVYQEPQPNVLGLGIAGLATSSLGLPGMIISIIARKKLAAINGPLSGQNKAAKILSTIGLIVGIIMTVVWTIDILIGIIAGIGAALS
ncbi:MAG: zinc ribbon domain-containing protein [Clostridia bacterium]|nr:zinc ribbon domain-containing protein [Clostridia bacterium]